MVVEYDHKSFHIEAVGVEDFNFNELNDYEDRTVFHSHEWFSFLKESQGAMPAILKIKHGDSVAGFFFGAIKKKFGFGIMGSPFKGWTTLYMGFTLHSQYRRRDVLPSILEFVFGELNCHHIEITDRYFSPGDGANLGMECDVGRSFLIDLRKTKEELYDAMEKKSCRWCIRKARKEGVVIEEANDPGFADDYCLQLKDVFSKQALVPTYSLPRVEQLIKHLGSTGNLLLLRARSPRGDCIATGIFLASNDMMIFWGGASLRKYQSFRPNELVIWHAMNHWKDKGIKFFDMGGGGEYKRKYGGAEIPVISLRKSKNVLISEARRFAKRAFRIKQRVQGYMKK